jgi:nitrite reductase/ring-hydroxylating ferredoxin subunit
VTDTDVTSTPRHRLADFAALEQLQPVLVGVGDSEVAVVRVQEKVYAFSSHCTHRPGPLVEGAVTWKGRVLCPWHLGTFDLDDGRPVSGPPQTPLPVYPTEIDNGVVWLLADPLPRDAGHGDSAAGCPAR